MAPHVPDEDGQYRQEIQIGQEVIRHRFWFVARSRTEDIATRDNPREAVHATVKFCIETGESPVLPFSINADFCQ